MCPGLLASETRASDVLKLDESAIARVGNGLT
jgi:hypothetical protein